jgi:hypothetical protein
MADKDFKMHLKTSGDTSGVKEVAKSIDDLEVEVSQLERELKRVPVGGKAFEQVAGQLKTARLALSEADKEAKRLGATMGRSGNAGMALLEFSRAAEDAKYGINGVLNNIPGLVAMLGLGPGIAGVASLAAVALSVFGDKLTKTKELTKEEEAFKDFADGIEGIAKASKSLASQRKQIKDGDMSDLFDLESKAIARQSQAFRANIELLRKRIQAAGGLDKSLTDLALAEVDTKARGGSISAGQAEEQAAAIKKAAAERELARQKELVTLNEKLALEEESKAKAQLDAAKRYQDITEGGLSAAESVLNQLKQRADLVKQIMKTSDDLLGDPKEAFSYTPEKIEAIRESGRNGNMPADISAEFESLFSLLKQLDQLGGIPEAGTAKAVQEELVRLKDSFSGAVAAVKAAEQNLKDATQSANQAREAGKQDRGALDDKAALEGIVDLQAQQQQAQKIGADAVATVLEDILNAIGDAAQRPQVQTQVDTVRQMLSDGLQSGEGEQLQTIMTQIVSALNSGDARRLTLMQQMRDAVSKGASTDQALADQIKVIKGQVDEVANKVKDLNAIVNKTPPW